MFRETWKSGEQLAGSEGPCVDDDDGRDWGSRHDTGRQELPRDERKRKLGH